MKIIEIIADENYIDGIKNISEKDEVLDCWILSGEDATCKIARILLPSQ